MSRSELGGLTDGAKHGQLMAVLTSLLYARPTSFWPYFVGAGLAACSLFAGAASASPRAWDLQDSVELRYIARDPGFAPARVNGTDASTTSAIVTSPSGEFFFFVSTWGELDTDSDVTALTVHRTRSVLNWLASGKKEPLVPYRSIVLRSRNFQGALSDPVWDADGRGIIFSSVPPDVGVQNSFRLDMDSGSVEPLTDAKSLSQQVSWAVTRGEGKLYSQTFRAPEPLPKYPAEWVARRSDGSIVRNAELAARDSEISIFASFRGQTQRIPKAAVGSLLPEALWLSPDGSKAVGVTQQFLSEPNGRVKGVLRLVLIDVRNARISLLHGLKAGSWGAYKGTTLAKPFQAAYWSADGTRVVIVNTQAPPERASANAVNEATDEEGVEVIPEDKLATDQYIVEYETASGTYRVLEPLTEVSSGAPRNVSAVGWLKQGHELLVVHESEAAPANGTVYTFGPGDTQKRDVPSTVTLPATKSEPYGGLHVELVQGANESPRVVASAAKRTAALTETDPALRGIQLLHGERFSWRESSEKTGVGMLTLPNGMKAGQRVPLVIQVSFAIPEFFLPDGPARSTDAAQVLAARGIAALQVEMPLYPAAKQEGPTFVARVESAVLELERRGLIDSSRVGLTGFSHAGYEVLYAITHPERVRWAAAMGSDFFRGSYSSYLEQAALTPPPSLVGGYEAVTGGSFWERKDEWLNFEPTFNVDKVTAPFLISSHGFSIDDWSPVRREAGDLLGLFGAFMRNHKPVEYLYLGYSNHQLSRPRERLASLSAMVDWMAFWLQGYEDPSPEKARQYARWRPMRDQLAKSPERADQISSATH